MMQQQPQPQAMTNMTGPMATMQVSLPLPALSTANSKDRQILLDEILKREPVEPARSPEVRKRKVKIILESDSDSDR